MRRSVQSVFEGLREGLLVTAFIFIAVAVLFCGMVAIFGVSYLITIPLQDWGMSSDLAYLLTTILGISGCAAVFLVADVYWG